MLNLVIAFVVGLAVARRITRGERRAARAEASVARGASGRASRPGKPVLPLAEWGRSRQRVGGRSGATVAPRAEQARENE